LPGWFLTEYFFGANDDVDVLFVIDAVTMIIAKTVASVIFWIIVLAAEIFEIKAVAFQVVFIEITKICFAQVFEYVAVTADDVIDLLIEARPPVAVIVDMCWYCGRFFPPFVIKSGAAGIIAEFPVFAAGPEGFAAFEAKFGLDGIGFLLHHIVVKR
jgi:hypothetical protein